MRAAHIEDGKVINIIEAEALDIWPGVELVEAEGAAIGDTWDGAAFHRPPPPPEPVPAVVSRFQARAAMMLTAASDPAHENLLAQVTAMVEASGDPMAKLAWAEAIEFRRDSPLVTQLAAGAGLGEPELDQLFRSAAQITA